MPINPEDEKELVNLGLVTRELVALSATDIATLTGMSDSPFDDDGVWPSAMGFVAACLIEAGMQDPEWGYRVINNITRNTPKGSQQIIGAGIRTAAPFRAIGEGSDD